MLLNSPISEYLRYEYAYMTKAPGFLMNENEITSPFVNDFISKLCKITRFSLHNADVLKNSKRRS